MLTTIEELQHQIDTLNIKSHELKQRHEHGDWDNWRMFTSYDIRIKELTIEILKLDVNDLKDSLYTYLSY